MEDKDKTDKNIPDKTSDEIKEENIEKGQAEQEKKDEIVEDDKNQEKKEIKIEKTEDIPKEDAEKIEKKEKPVKAQPKKEDKKKKDDKKPDFKYIVRLANTDINGEKNVLYGLTSIKGIGLHMSSLITNEIDIDRFTKIGDLSDTQVEKLQEILNDINNRAPNWMLNHRKDYDTGKNIHLISSEIDMKLRDEINLMKKIRSYRGIRHERGLPVRGQRTRANNRTGLTLGVSKKREPSSK